ncbi:MAG: TIGR02281 family clan AA aspartic protease [Nitrospiraceae bacterium]|nr:MAG: TIGR02281 family clan AA aspartic protease [Nitrospiraceae bacterium]
MSKIIYIKCGQCQADNDSSLSYCSKCGTPLEAHNGDSGAGRRIALYMLLVLLVCAIIFVFFYRMSSDPEDRTAGITSEEKEKYEKRLDELEAKLRDARKKLLAANITQDSEAEEQPDVSLDELKVNENVIAGWVRISDPWDRQVRKFRAGMTRNGWLALPSRACLGGNKWVFYPDSGGEYNISGGLWIGGDKVGLWQITGKSSNQEISELGSWNTGSPVSWISLESDNEIDLITMPAGPARGFFISTSLTDDIKESGIFLQNGRIVGWTFGKWLEEGYMWPGSDGADLEHNNWVTYFYDLTFAHGREEKFAMALSLPNNSDALELLSAFVSGFSLQPRLALKDTPEYLLTKEIIKKMRVLVTRAVREGSGGKVVELLNSRVLKDIADIYLLIDVVRIMADELGYGTAISEIEDSGRYIATQSGGEVPALDKLHLQYYQDWLDSLVSAASIDNGWQVFNSAKSYYPDDPNIHLSGVELALLDGDWQEAERLLYMMEYPSAYQDRVQLLALRISEMKGEEGKIVVNFTPGSSRITVDGAINDSVNQNFLIDTGATFVTITSATAEALGLYVGAPRHTLSTVGGTVKASAVIIDSLEIDGWVEYDIRAFVVDIPNRPGLGLLGLNYLGRFKMDLNSDQGTLLLTPR